MRVLALLALAALCAGQPTLRLTRARHQANSLIGPVPLDDAVPGPAATPQAVQAAGAPVPAETAGDVTVLDAAQATGEGLQFRPGTQQELNCVHLRHVWRRGPRRRRLPGARGGRARRPPAPPRARPHASPTAAGDGASPAPTPRGAAGAAARPCALRPRTPAPPPTRTPKALEHAPPAPAACSAAPPPSPPFPHSSQTPTPRPLANPPTLTLPPQPTSSPPWIPFPGSSSSSLKTT